jgi:hypothetical protein
MPSKIEKNTASPLSVALDEYDASAQVVGNHLKKIREKIARYKKANPTPKEVEKLKSELTSLSKEPATPLLLELIDKLGKHLAEMKKTFVSDISRSIQEYCSQKQIDCRFVGENIGVGPCSVSIDSIGDKAVITYAKFEIANKSLAAEDIVDHICDWKTLQFDRVVDPKKTREQLEEATRVIYARKNRPFKGNLRVELPLLFREMKFINTGETAAVSKATPDYSLSRFVIELSKTVHSDENLRSENRLQLETAVIDNANNPKRSVFVPKDLNVGYGEGTYFQALTYSV